MTEYLPTLAARFRSGETITALAAESGMDYRALRQYLELQGIDTQRGRRKGDPPAQPLARAEPAPRPVIDYESLMVRFESGEKLDALALGVGLSASTLRTNLAQRFPGRRSCACGCAEMAAGISMYVNGHEMRKRFGLSPDEPTAREKHAARVPPEQAEPNWSRFVTCPRCDAPTGEACSRIDGDARERLKVRHVGRSLLPGVPRLSAIADDALARIAAIVDQPGTHKDVGPIRDILRSAGVPVAEGAVRHD